MKNILPSILLLLSCIQTIAQEVDIMADNEAFRAELNADYADSTKSPLSAADRATFEALPFYPIDAKWRVVAEFKRTKKSKPFAMNTTTDRKPVYEVYGTATFSIDGITHQLNVYQSHQLRSMAQYKDLLFLPFNDLSNGDGSYGGGRFIDLKIPEGDKLVIDFNKAYNPYCAYNAKYSCPIPPKENFLNLKVEAGVQSPDK